MKLPTSNSNELLTPLCESFVLKVNSFSVFVIRTMQEDADTGTTIAE
jgi:hypothetical protein